MINIMAMSNIYTHKISNLYSYYLSMINLVAYIRAMMINTFYNIASNNKINFKALSTYMHRYYNINY